MGTMIRDPNAPPDPSEVAPIPDYQHGGDDWVGAPHNLVPPGAPPSPDYPTGAPPDGTGSMQAQQMPAETEPPAKTAKDDHPPAPKKK